MLQTATATTIITVCRPFNYSSLFPHIVLHIVSEKSILIAAVDLAASVGTEILKSRIVLTQACTHSGAIGQHDLV